MIHLDKEGKRDQSAAGASLATLSGQHSPSVNDAGFIDGLNEERRGWRGGTVSQSIIYTTKKIPSDLEWCDLPK